MFKGWLWIGDHFKMNKFTYTQLPYIQKICQCLVFAIAVLKKNLPQEEKEIKKRLGD